MKNTLSLIALCIAASTSALADDQSTAKGFVEDSHLDVLLRNAYMNRDYKHHNKDKMEWGQGVIGTFTSGFTQGTVGVGVDAFGLYGLRLDGGKGRVGAAGIDFFKPGDSGHAQDDIARGGAAVKARFSNTVVKFGDQMPALPVLSYDDSRLLPESYTGTLITSKEIEGLELNAGHFTAEARKSAEGRDSGGLKRIDVLGGSYRFNDQFSASLYGSDVEDVLKKQYVNLNYVYPIAKDRSLTLDFNGYRTRLDKDFAKDDNRTNRIWSLAATYAMGAHSFTLAHQRSSGDIGYLYGGYQSADYIGDGGTTIWLANSYWSDFNGKDENSWQVAYGLDFAEYGIPGLSYRVAYVRGDNIDAGQAGRGQEREIFNQLQYLVQEGPAKDLKLKLRSSMLRASNNVNSYVDDGNEVRVFVEYPIRVF
ncbi:MULTISPECIES: OprD family porin [Pseudomonadaceae]|uniref:OprD family porin n=1 Tax=Pseudomonadaceae TaxID=135621 RepID=UPI001F18E0FC|nr:MULTISPECIES: OprD family porin [Pseudomonas]MDH0339384.1 OprD family porin [Pseudomonas otitidis]MDH1109909.1 OprD family porin [Pseudomonas otitidis]MDH1159808.1 OprD family porin [Pseudomonas otitidis]MDH1162784.1 OprD family porin [Pseudomonas otitidis]MDU9397530.1 OprD family porin [Pseudomonas sp. zfem003]